MWIRIFDVSDDWRSDNRHSTVVFVAYGCHRNTFGTRIAFSFFALQLAVSWNKPQSLIRANKRKTVKRNNSAIRHSFLHTFCSVFSFWFIVFLIAVPLYWLFTFKNPVYVCLGKDWQRDGWNKWITMRENRQAGTFYFAYVAALAELLNFVSSREFLDATRIWVIGSTKRGDKGGVGNSRL